MTNQPEEEQTYTVGLPLDGANDISDSDGDHHADGFEQIGVLAERILSRAKARKKTEEIDAAACSVNFAQATIGGVANKQDDTPDLQAGPITKQPEASIVRLDIRAQIRRNRCSLEGHANENFRTDKLMK